MLLFVDFCLDNIRRSLEYAVFERVNTPVHIGLDIIRRSLELPFLSMKWPTISEFGYSTYKFRT